MKLFVRLAIASIFLFPVLSSAGEPLCIELTTILGKTQPSKHALFLEDQDTINSSNPFQSINGGISYHFEHTDKFKKTTTNPIIFRPLIGVIQTIDNKTQLTVNHTSFSDGMTLKGQSNLFNNAVEVFQLKLNYQEEEIEVLECFSRTPQLPHDCNKRGDASAKVVNCSQFTTNQ